jgi:oligopeptide transport system ATP-binding protein
MAARQVRGVPPGDRSRTVSVAGPPPEVLLAAEDVVKHFQAGRGLVRKQGQIHALDGVTVELRAGEALGIVGESGSGKTTLANLLMLLERPTAGRVTYLGRDISMFTKDERKVYRRQVQMVFQDTVGALNPRMTIADIIGEPWRIHSGVVPRRDRPARTRDLLARVGMNPDLVDRYPHQLSGGQRQRVGIARALALEPKVLICDEPVSALDVSIQAQVLNLLKDLRDDFGLSYVFIAHDLSVIRQVADRVAVMYLGKVVEIGDEGEVLLRPSHPYTQALLSALPSPEREDMRTPRIVLAGDLPSPTNPPSACRFRTRCWKAQELCEREEPALIDRGTGHPAACHFVEVAERVTGIEPA